MVRMCPPEWMEGLVLPTVGPSPKLKAIIEYFNVHEIKTFEGLDIWHIPELHSLFCYKMDREPRQ